MKRILVAPLDWGLGHAARCIPVIKELLKNNVEVIIAADKNPLALLQKEFPLLEFIRLPGYDVSYPTSNEKMAVKMIFQIPKILSKISEENKFLQKIVKEKKINGVISDQRFGLHSSLVPCVFITHQIMIKSFLGKNFLYKINRSFIEKYDECWIPDIAGNENLSGDLSHKYPLPENAKFIGLLSRFKNHKSQITNHKSQFMAIISGPEPQRTIFEKIVLEELKKSEKKSILVRGLANENKHFTDGNVEIHSHLETQKMLEKILSSEIIISRSGYSTIMDLTALNKKAILIPTPGQTEQEYLADYHHYKKNFVKAEQKNFNLISSLEKIPNNTDKKIFPENLILKNAIRQFTENC